MLESSSGSESKGDSKKESHLSLDPEFFSHHPYQSTELIFLLKYALNKNLEQSNFLNEASSFEKSQLLLSLLSRQMSEYIAEQGNLPGTNKYTKRRVDQAVDLIENPRASMAVESSRFGDAMTSLIFCAVKRLSVSTHFLSKLHAVVEKAYKDFNLTYDVIMSMSTHQQRAFNHYLSSQVDTFVLEHFASYANTDRPNDIALIYYFVNFLSAYSVYKENLLDEFLSALFPRSTSLLQPDFNQGTLSLGFKAALQSPLFSLELDPKFYALCAQVQAYKVLCHEGFERHLNQTYFNDIIHEMELSPPKVKPKVPLALSSDEIGDVAQKVCALHLEDDDSFEESSSPAQPPFVEENGIPIGYQRLCNFFLNMIHYQALYHDKGSLELFESEDISLEQEREKFPFATSLHQFLKSLSVHYKNDKMPDTKLYAQVLKFAIGFEGNSVEVTDEFYHQAILAITHPQLDVFSEGFNLSLIHKQTNTYLLRAQQEWFKDSLELNYHDILSLETKCDTLQQKFELNTKEAQETIEQLNSRLESAQRQYDSLTKEVKKLRKAQLFFNSDEGHAHSDNTPSMEFASADNSPSTSRKAKIFSIRGKKSNTSPSLHGNSEDSTLHRRSSHVNLNELRKKAGSLSPGQKRKARQRKSTE